MLLAHTYLQKNNFFLSIQKNNFTALQTTFPHCGFFVDRHPACRLTSFSSVACCHPDIIHSNHKTQMEKREIKTNPTSQLPMLSMVSSCSCAVKRFLSAKVTSPKEPRPRCIITAAGSSSLGLRQKGCNHAWRCHAGRRGFQ